MVLLVVDNEVTKEYKVKTKIKLQHFVENYINILRQDNDEKNNIPNNIVSTLICCNNKLIETDLKDKKNII